LLSERRPHCRHDFFSGSGALQSIAANCLSREIAT